MGILWRAFNELITPKPFLKLDNCPSKRPIYKTMKATIGLQRLEIDIPCGFGMFSRDEYPDSYFSKVVNLQMLEYQQWLIFEKSSQICFFIWDYKTRFLLGKEGLGSSGNIRIDVHIMPSDESMTSLRDLQFVISDVYREETSRQLREAQEVGVDKNDKFKLTQYEMKLNRLNNERPPEMEEVLISDTPYLFYELEEVRGRNRYYALLLDEHHYLMINLKTSIAGTTIEGLKQERIAHQEDMQHLLNGIRFYTA